MGLKHPAHRQTQCGSEPFVTWGDIQGNGVAAKEIRQSRKMGRISALSLIQPTGFDRFRGWMVLDAVHREPFWTVNSLLTGKRTEKMRKS